MGYAGDDFLDSILIEVQRIYGSYYWLPVSTAAGIRIRGSLAGPLPKLITDKAPLTELESAANIGVHPICHSSSCIFSGISMFASAFVSKLEGNPKLTGHLNATSKSEQRCNEIVFESPPVLRNLKHLLGCTDNEGSVSAFV